LQTTTNCLWLLVSASNQPMVVLNILPKNILSLSNLENGYYNPRVSLITETEVVHLLHLNLAPVANTAKRIKRP
jgi:hypothetical protein